MTLAPPPREDPPKAPVRMTAEVAAAQTKVHKALIKTRLHKQQLEVVYCQIGEVVKQGENKHLFPSRLYDITRITLLADGYNVSPDGGSGRTLIAW